MVLCLFKIDFKSLINITYIGSKYLYIYSFFVALKSELKSKENCLGKKCI